MAFLAAFLAGAEAFLAAFLAGPEALLAALTAFLSLHTGVALTSQTQFSCFGSLVGCNAHGLFFHRHQTVAFDPALDGIQVRSLRLLLQDIKIHIVNSTRAKSAPGAADLS